MRVVLDIEADGLLETASVMWCAVAKDVDTEKVYRFFPNGTDYTKSFLQFLSTCSLVAIHHGLGYDLPLLDKLFNFSLNCEIVDTLVVSRTIYPNISNPVGCKHGPHSIEAWGLRFGRLKPEHKDWSKFSMEMLHRCEEDVEILFRLYKKQEEDLQKHNWGPALRLNHKLFEILQKQEEYGCSFDRKYAEKSIRLLSKWIERIDNTVANHLPLNLVVNESKIKGEYNYVSKPFKQNGKYTKQVETFLEGIDNNTPDKVSGIRICGPFCRISFARTDLNKPQQIKNFLLDLGWEPKEWNTNNEGLRTSPKLSHNDPFNGVSGKLGQLVAKRIQCRHRRSQIEGWLSRLRSDGRIPQFITGLASTGRATHSGVVNVPGSEAFFGKQMRRCFSSKDSYVLVGTDAAGCQNRMLASRVNDPNFTKILLEGKKEDKTSIHFVNQKAIKEIAGIDVTYHEAKTLNYAFLFGASDKKLGRTVRQGEEVGAKIRKALLSVSPGFEKLVESITTQWKQTAKVRPNKWGGVEYYGGWVEGLDGRPIFIEQEHTILVYLLQSDEAIMMAAAYCFLYKWCQKKKWVWGEDWAYEIWMHDEYQAEVRSEIAQEFAVLAEQAIAKAGEFYHLNCPQEGESKIGKNWYETH